MRVKRSEKEGGKKRSILYQVKIFEEAQNALKYNGFFFS